MFKFEYQTIGKTTEIYVWSRVNGKHTVVIDTDDLYWLEDCHLNIVINSSGYLYVIVRNVGAKRALC